MFGALWPIWSHTVRVGGAGSPNDRGNGAGREPGSGPPGRLPDPDHVIIPDDISELDPEIRAYHREIAHRRRVGRLRRLPIIGRLPQTGLSLPVFAMTLLLVALMTGLSALITPPAPDHPRPQPLASTPIQPGAVGGLLPDVSVRLYGDEVPLRTRRPAVIALPRPDCTCAAALDALYRKAKSHRMLFDLVGAPDQVTDLHALDRRIGNGGAVVFVDPEGTLSDTYGAGELTVLVVGADGVVLAILNDPQPATPVESLLERAVGAAA